MLRTHPTTETAGASDLNPYVGLLGGFRCVVSGEPLFLPLGCQRLIAFLAIHDRPLQRSYVASNLWLDKDGRRAGANLRSALWRLGQFQDPVVIADGSSIFLHPGVAVDVRWLTDEAYRLARHESDGDDLPHSETFRLDLLPDWFDEWLVLERERLRQLRLHALDLLSAALVSSGQALLAVDAACMAVAAEPLRESAHRALISAHLAAGNPVAATRQYEHFRVSLRDAVGLEPSPEMHRLLAEALSVAP